MMKRNQTVAIAVLGAPLLVLTGTLLVWPKVPSNSDVSSCNDPIESCKKPVYVGSSGRCSCFTCEDGSVVCTEKPTDKLTLYETEALRRDTEGLIRALPANQRFRLEQLGIGSQDFGKDLKFNPPPQNRNLNTNRLQDNRSDTISLPNSNRIWNANQRASPTP
jgi:hypothetical protein